MLTDSPRNAADLRCALTAVTALANTLAKHADPLVAEAARQMQGQLGKAILVAVGYPHNPGDVCDRCGHVEASG